MRIVDVPSGRLVAHGTAAAGAPRATNDAARLATVGDTAELSLVQSAIAPSYAG